MQDERGIRTTVVDDDLHHRIVVGYLIAKDPSCHRRRQQHCLDRNIPLR